MEIHFSTLEFLIFIKNFYKHMARKLKKYLSALCPVIDISRLFEIATSAIARYLNDKYILYDSVTQLRTKS